MKVGRLVEQSWETFPALIESLQMRELKVGLTVVSNVNTWKQILIMLHVEACNMYWDSWLTYLYPCAGNTGFQWITAMPFTEIALSWRELPYPKLHPLDTACGLWWSRQDTQAQPQCSIWDSSEGLFPGLELPVGLNEVQLCTTVGQLHLLPILAFHLRKLDPLRAFLKILLHKI